MEKALFNELLEGVQEMVDIRKAEAAHKTPTCRLCGSPMVKSTRKYIPQAVTVRYRCYNCWKAETPPEAE